jgi:peptidylprolyl isomerase
VIEGWELGIADGDGLGPMREGGRRMLTIPPELAYGDRGAGEAIGPGETLVYVIDLLEVSADEP